MPSGEQNQHQEKKKLDRQWQAKASSELFTVGSFDLDSSKLGMLS